MIHRLISSLPEPAVNSLRSLIGKSVLLHKTFGSLKKLLSHQNGIIVNGLGEGLKFNCTNGRLAYLRGDVEEEEQALLLALLDDGDVFYDIGANIGFFSAIAARLVGSEGHVYAFEPIPESAKVAVKNAQLNGFEQVTVVEVAVSSTNGYVSMGTENNYSETYTVGSGEVQVQCVTLDNVIEDSNFRAPDFIKIDVEGHEIDVIQGAAEVLRTEQPVLLIEVHWLGDQFLSFCRDTIEPMGYEVTQLDGSPLPEGAARYHALARPIA